MGTQRVKLAVIIKNPLNQNEFFLSKQTPPPKFDDSEYDSYQDSDLWDLPSAQLSLLDNSSSCSPVQIEVQDASFTEFLNQFDLNSALNQILGEVGLQKCKVNWAFSKVVEEPEFGPGIPAKTIYIVGDLEKDDENLTGLGKWMSSKDCEHLLLEVKPHDNRIGLLAAGIVNDSMQRANLSIPAALRYQEYPPSVKVVPMSSKTAKPFHTTNLVVFFPGTNYGSFACDNFVANGDALIMDPGCHSGMHKELEQIVKALPRKLLVFVTHHHHDHVDGLAVVQKSNPEATLLAHENTIRRISKDHWSLRTIPILGSEEICVGLQQLRPISAPGHTDGHMALLHVATNTLIVGDHCVGEGSALLDIHSGGNMSDYFHTTYKFMDLSPHVLIPMHGRVNMWPKHMLCGYLKHRRSRESKILKAIQDGAETLFDMVADTYANVDRSLWMFASYNVRLHVEHLAQQNKLPSEFSMQRFQSTCKLNFFTRWMWEYLCSMFPGKFYRIHIGKLLGAGTVAAVAVLYSFRRINDTNKYQD